MLGVLRWKSYQYSLISSSLHWPWLFWEILRDSYLPISAKPISVANVMVNGRYIHFYKNKYNKLTPYIIDIIKPTPCNQVQVNGTTCYATYPTAYYCLATYS